MVCKLLVPREAGLHVVGICLHENQICFNTPCSLALSTRRGPQIRPSFLRPASTKTWTGGKGLSCFSQGMGKATLDPCGTVLYIKTKSHYINPSSNAIIPPLTGFTSNAHIPNSNPTHPHSYVTHIKSSLQKLSNVYIPPNTNNINKSITNIFIHPTSLPNSIITGDFNAHSPFMDHRSQLITSLIFNSNHIVLNQNVSTRLPLNHKQQSIFPDITTADTTISANLTWQTPKALNSDHLPMLIKFKNIYKILTTKPFRSVTNHRKANWLQYTKDVEHTLKNTLLHEDPRTASHLITNAILASDRKNVPKGTVKPTSRKNHYTYI